MKLGTVVFVSFVVVALAAALVFESSTIPAPDNLPPVVVTGFCVFLGLFFLWLAVANEWRRD